MRRVFALTSSYGLTNAEAEQAAKVTRVGLVANQLRPFGSQTLALHWVAYGIQGDGVRCVDSSNFLRQSGSDSLEELPMTSIDTASAAARQDRADPDETWLALIDALLRDSKRGQLLRLPPCWRGWNLR